MMPIQHFYTSSRRGFSLLELLFVITIGAAIMGIAITSLAALLRIHLIDDITMKEGNAQRQLMDTFRSDVRIATKWTKPADVNATIWKFIRPDGNTASYEFKKGVVTRLLHDSEKLVARERFFQGEEARLRIEAPERWADKRLSMLQLVIEYPADKSATGATRTWRVAAALGADHRFASLADD